MNLVKLVLRNGDNIDDCEGLVRQFCDEVNGDGSYQYYDSVPIAADNQLVESDIRMANKLKARIPLFIVPRLLEKAATINTALSNIPVSLSLAEPAEVIPWKALGDLFAAVLMEHVRIASATKILHKKRPELIPIFDSVVVDNYAYPLVSSSRKNFSWMPEPLQAVEYCKVMKLEVDKNRDELSQLRSRLRQENIHLGIVRLLDILIWAKYAPWPQN